MEFAAEYTKNNNPKVLQKMVGLHTYKIQIFMWIWTCRSIHKSWICKFYGDGEWCVKQAELSHLGTEMATRNLQARTKVNVSNGILNGHTTGCFFFCWKHNRQLCERVRVVCPSAISWRTRRRWNFLSARQCSTSLQSWGTKCPRCLIFLLVDWKRKMNIMSHMKSRLLTHPSSLMNTQFIWVSSI